MTKMITALLFALAALLLLSCGGGGSSTASAPKHQIVSMYGDSLSVSPPEDPPAAQLARRLGSSYEVGVRAHGGVMVNQVLTGVAPPGGDPAVWPFKPFAEQVAVDKPDIILLRLGGADVVRGTDVGAVAQDLTKIVQAARGSGASVYLIGVIESPMFPQASAQMDVLNQTVAREQGVNFIGVRDLPFDPDKDLGNDHLHAAAGYNDRIMARVADVLRA